ncbi:MAG: AMP-binding protein, partial [Pyrinomonadaceae bacterium]
MIRELLERGEASHPAVTVAGEGPAVTYDGLRRQVDALARGLRALGINRGDRVAMALPNGFEMLASFLAAATAATAAPLNPAYKLEEFRFYLEDTGARALIVPPRGAAEARAAAAPETLIIEADLDADGHVRLQAAGPSAAEPPAAAGRDSDDIALVLHTSGTTSRPKRVPLSHANLAASARTVAGTYGLTHADVSLCVMPLFHVHGLVASALATLATGGTLVLVPRFNPLSFWATAGEHRATWYSAVPT